MKNRVIAFLKSNRYAFAAFFLPVLILVLAFAVIGIYPFGQQQMAVIDMYHQYVPFLGELQYRLQGGGSLFYSWNSGGGCNFWCLLSYYGASPLNLILFLFPKKLIMEGVTVIFLVKAGLTGSFMYIYLKNAQSAADSIVDRRSGWHTVAFACMYALCSYVIGYHWCIMWMDAVMLLPLCILGLTRLVKDGKMAMYTVTLALIMFCNYYIAGMVCIFILCYYPVLYFATVRGRGTKACLMTALRAVGCSLLGIAMSAVMFLPTYISMKNAYYFSSTMPEDWTFYNDALDIINQLLPNAHLTYIDGLPNLATSLLVVIMLVFYFISREIPLREKAFNGAFLVLMFFSLNLNKLDFIWHGMHFPNQLPFRYSFVICFVLVAMAYRAFKRVDSISTKVIAAVCAGGVAYYVIVQKLLADKIDNMLVFFYYGLALLVLYCIVLMLYRTQRITRHGFTALIVVVVAAEMCITTCTEMNLVGTSSRETYNENKSDITRLAAYANEKGGATDHGGDGTFSRTEIDDAIIHNCPAFYHYRGMGQFSSTLNANTTELMEKIGLEGHPGNNRFNFNETSPVTCAITNVNYLIAKNMPLKDSDYKYVRKSGYSKLYKSNYPMSIGYMLPNSIRTWNPIYDNPFYNLDDYVSAATDGQVSRVFIDKGNGKIGENNVSSYYESDGVVESRILDETEAGSLSLNFTADTNEKYYVYVSTDYAEEITIEREDSKKNLDVQEDCGSILNIGKLKKGENFNVKIDFKSGLAGRVTCYVSTLDYDAWNKAYGMISDDLMTVTGASDTDIKGTVNVAEEGVLVTSIPYDKGWSLKVDGETREINDLTGGVWISAGLEKGTHEIELTFRPPGIIAGLIITLLSILVLIFATVLQGALQRRKCQQEGSDYNTE